MKVFEYMIVYDPSKGDKKKGAEPKVLKNIEVVLAKDAQVVSMMAVREIPKDYEDRLGDIDILVRPF